MENITNQEIKRRLKKHPHAVAVNMVFAAACAAFVAKFFVPVDWFAVLDVVMCVLGFAGFAYTFKMRKEIKDAHRESMKK